MKFSEHTHYTRSTNTMANANDQKPKYTLNNATDASNVHSPLQYLLFARFNVSMFQYFAGLNSVPKTKVVLLRRWVKLQNCFHCVVPFIIQNGRKSKMPCYAMCQCAQMCGAWLNCVELLTKSAVANKYVCVCVCVRISFRFVYLLNSWKYYAFRIHSSPCLYVLFSCVWVYFPIHVASDRFRNIFTLCRSPFLFLFLSLS